MKRIRSFTIMALLLAVSALLLAGCVSKPANLEEVIASDEEIGSELETTAKNAGMTVEVKGNEIIYTYDLASIEGTTEDDIRDEDMLSVLESSIDSARSSYIDVCKSLEKKTGFTGIKMTINYNYGNETLITKTFTADE